MKKVNFSGRFFRGMVQIILCLTVAGINSAEAITFTAVNSGNFNNILTWSGGVAPGVLLTSDSVVIPSGITVTLNLNETFNNAAALVVNGLLTSAGGPTALIMTGGSLNGSGVLSADSLVLGLNNSGFNFTGSVTTRVLTSVGTTQSTYASVTVNSYLYINSGTFTLTSGTVSLANNVTIVMAGGSIAVSGTGSLDLTNTYNLIYTNASVNTGVELTGSGLNNLTINLPVGSVYFMSDASVHGILTMNSGFINLGTHSLTVGSSGTINGGNSYSYAITSSGGSFVAYVAAGYSTSFPVGTSAHYAPVIISANSSSASGNIAVIVKDSVLARGSAGASLSAMQSVVNATWFISSTLSSGLDLNLQLIWSASMELNGFNRNSAYISHYTNGSWDMATPAAATTLNNNMYAMTRNNITSFSPFTVADNNAHLNLGLKPLVANNNAVSVYPSPVSNTLYFNTSAKPDYVRISSIDGRLIKTIAINNTNNISVADLLPGIYNITFYGQETSATQKFLKE